ncbi:MAG: hypothetical protein EOO16_11905 [Chitinophagaceae bacterium]|nr:MAG: hypothetical protein EOO16_11905 [Chitinophagaceae bacterium]
MMLMVRDPSGYHFHPVPLSSTLGFQTSAPAVKIVKNKIARPVFIGLVAIASRFCFPDDTHFRKPKKTPKRLHE